MDNIQPLLPLAYNISEAADTTFLLPQDVPLVGDGGFAYQYDLRAGSTGPDCEVAFGDENGLRFVDSFLPGASLNAIRPSMRDLQLPMSRTRSLTDEDKDKVKARRRTQNRFAQRAYRQRKEQAIKDQEREIESLQHQLAKEKKLNQDLTNVIESLKERLGLEQTITATAGAATAEPDRIQN